MKTPRWLKISRDNEARKYKELRWLINKTEKRNRRLEKMQKTQDKDLPFNIRLVLSGINDKAKNSEDKAI